MPQLTLYYMPGCPYCQKVMRFMEQSGIKLLLKNIMERSEIRQGLISIGGKSQVPCLVIDGRAVYESDDIIEWLRENHAGRKM